MNHDLKAGSVAAIQNSFQELLEIVEVTSNDADAAHEEIQDVVNSLIGAILMKEDGIRADEKTFFEMLVSYDKSKSCNNRLLIDLAERWQSLRHSIPAFFNDARTFDQLNQTHYAAAIRCHIQTIGNSAAIADTGFGRSESKIVRDYIKALEVAE